MCFVAPKVILMVVSICAFFAYYGVIIAKEERRLANLFGDAFQAYAATTPRFFPRVERPSTEEKVLVNAKAFL